MTKVNRVNKVDKVDKVNKVNRVNRVDRVGTFCDDTAEVFCKRVVCVINADLCCSINYRSFKGLLILKVLQRFPNKNL
jgi:hypothetical protein